MERGESPTKHEESALTSDNRVYVPARVTFPNGRPSIKSAKGVILVDGWCFVYLFMISNSFVFSL